MSTAGSVRSGAQSQYGPPVTGAGAEPPRKRVRVFRWEGILPLLVVFALALGGWTLFGDLVVRDTLSEAATKAFGAQFDIASVKVRTMATTVELRGIALADPFDRNRNLVEAGTIVLALDPRPLLEKKFVVNRLTIADVRTGTRRATPARVVGSGGFARAAMAEVKKFADQFQVPAVTLKNLGELKDVVLNPSQLKAVQAALQLGARADSTKSALETSYANLRLQETLDSSRALLTRLQGTNVRTLGIDGARKAVADIRRAVARVDSAKGRVESLAATTRRGADSLQRGLALVDEARRQDYLDARALLQLPTFDGPDLGSALFGRVTIDRFEQAMYWATLARKYAPPGLLPRETEGPKRMRLPGTTIRFATPESYPRFLLQRANVDVTVSDGAQRGRYVFAASDVTSDPAIVGRPAVFALRRVARGGSVDSLRATGTMDHTATRHREVLNVNAAGVSLPTFTLPMLPLVADAGRGTSEMRFVFDGERITGRWAVRTAELTWRSDSARARALNTVETLVSRVLTGIHSLDLQAEIGGTVAAPTLLVRSNLDRQIADRLKTVAGEEIAAAQSKVRAQVDRIVEERTAPLRARVADVRAEGERRVAEARTRLDEEKRKLEDRLKTLSGGLVGLPGLRGE